MKHFRFLLPLLCCLAGSVAAQDTLWVQRGDGVPFLEHAVKSGETLFMLARRYSVPPAVLADLNHMNYTDGLTTGDRVSVPLDKYNFITTAAVAKSRPLFMKAAPGDGLVSVSRMVGVSQSSIQRWNALNNTQIKPGKALLIGWIAYDKEQVPFPGSNTTITGPAKAPVKPAAQPAGTRQAPIAAAEELPDTDSIATPTAFELLYEQQVEGVVLTEESGAAVFYPLKTKAAAGTYYAFHNTALKGSILKITNPANNKTIYAKVIGGIPNLKEYHNSVVGLSGNASEALGALDRRMFCKIQYR